MTDPILHRMPPLSETTWALLAVLVVFLLGMAIYFSGIGEQPEPPQTNRAALETPEPAEDCTEIAHWSEAHGCLVVEHLSLHRTTGGHPLQLVWTRTDADGREIRQ